MLSQKVKAMEGGLGSMAIEEARHQVEKALAEYLSDAGREALTIVFKEMGKIDLKDVSEKAMSIHQDPKSFLKLAEEYEVDDEKLIALATAMLASWLEKKLKESEKE